MSKSADKKPKSRKKVINPNPNPLFIKWLEEWKDESAKRGFKTQYVYQKAITSMKKYPLVLKSGKEALILENIGEKICTMLDERLAKHIQEHGPIEDPVKSLDGMSSSDDESEVPSSQNSKKGKSKKEKTYIPIPGTGPHALLTTLYNEYELGHSGWTKKADLINAAQLLCEKSFTMPDPGSFYTAWNSMATLIKKGFVIKASHPPKFQLTDSGIELVGKLMEAAQKTGQTSKPTTASALDKPSTSGSSATSEKKRKRAQIMELSDSDDLSDEGVPTAQLPLTTEPTVPSSTNTSTASTTKPSVPDIFVPLPLRPSNQFVLSPGQFIITLCVDNCETIAGMPNTRKDVVQRELRANGVNFDVRKLHVGDFVWIAREIVQARPGQLHLPKARELVLDYIVERKRMDDLAQSITDGRFHEQKHRLKNSGLKRPIYLVEDYGSKDNFSIPRSTLEQAIMNTQVIDSFTLKRTKDQKESIAYLTIMTRYLQDFYSGKLLQSCDQESYQQLPIEIIEENGFLMTFEEFNSLSRKNRSLTVQEIFGKQILQLNGMSVDKALAILEAYPTFTHLLSAYRSCNNDAAKEKLLSGIRFGKANRTIGPAISRSLYQLYNQQSFSASIVASN